jgi:Xaa-Pro dipeptidase
MERLIALVIDARDEYLRLVLPALEEEAARAVTPEGTILCTWTDANGPGTAVEAALESVGQGDRVGIERRQLSVERFDLLTSVAPTVELVGGDSTLTRVRAIKSEAELEHMRHAAEIADGVIERMTAGELRPGRTEAELSAECARLCREAGADAIAGEPQVVGGVRSALPHGHAGAYELESGDFVTVDLGVASGGYFADISRTFVLGEAESRQKELFSVVREAQLAGIRAATAGRLAADVDRAARNVIRDADLGEYFVHRTGHGLGLEIHEEPSLSDTNTEPLLDGMVVTIEPGVYVPGFGGVRIEDDIVVRPQEAEVLTRAPVVLEIAMP